MIQLLQRFSPGTRRVAGWWIATTIGALLVLAFAPQQLQVLVFKIAQVTIALKIAYWADRFLFANAPKVERSMPRDTFSAARILARAIVALAVILGLTLGI